MHNSDAIPLRVLRATFGMEAPTFDFQVFKTPGVDGATMGSTVTASRDEVRLPLFMWALNRAHMRELRSELIAAIRPTNTGGFLELSEDVGTDSGDVRRLSAVYRGGLEGDGTDMGDRWWAFTLRFQALDPYWYSTKPITASWSGLPATPFFPFTLPWSPSRSGVVAVDVLDVRGDADSWPSFDLRGPFTRVRVTAADGTHFWEVTRPTSESEMLRLVTKPGGESLRLLTSPDGVAWSDRGSRWGALHPDSWFTPLRFRDQVTVDVDGTSDGTRVELSAPEAWNTAP